MPDFLKMCDEPLLFLHIIRDAVDACDQEEKYKNGGKTTLIQGRNGVGEEGPESEYFFSEEFEKHATLIGLEPDYVRETIAISRCWMQRALSEKKGKQLLAA